MLHLGAAEIRKVNRIQSCITAKASQHAEELRPQPRTTTHLQQVVHTLGAEAPIHAREVFVLVWFILQNDNVHVSGSTFKRGMPSLAMSVIMYVRTVHMDT